MIDFKVPKVMGDTRKRINITVLLDSSGSMQCREADVIAGFNAYLSDLKLDNATNKFLTLLTFDSDHRCLFQHQHIDDVALLNNETYRPIGPSTALFDAVGSNLQTLPDNPDCSNLVVIITDGQENSSYKFTKTKVAELMKKKQDTGKYTIVFLGADQDAWENSKDLGFSMKNTKSFKSDDFRDTFRDLSVRSAVYSQNVSMNMGATQDFYSDPAPANQK